MQTLRIQQKCYNPPRQLLKKKMFLTCVNVTNQIKQDNMLIQIPILSFKTHYDDPKSNYNRDNYTCTTRLIPNWLN